MMMIIILILEPWEEQSLPDDRGVPAEGPETLWTVLPKAAGALLEAPLTGAGHPAWGDAFYPTLEPALAAYCKAAQLLRECFI